MFQLKISWPEAECLGKHNHRFCGIFEIRIPFDFLFILFLTVMFLVQEYFYLLKKGSQVTYKILKIQIEYSDVLISIRNR